MAEDFDTAFELLPADGSDLSEDEALNAALGELEPEEQEETLPFGRGWRFDYTAGQFERLGRSPAEVHDLDNLREWIHKALRTSRFAHPIHSDEYGLEYIEIVGRPLDAGVIGVYANAVTDALTAHDRITGVENFRFTRDPDDDALFVEFEVITDEGDRLLIDSQVEAPL